MSGNVHVLLHEGTEMHVMSMGDTPTATRDPTPRAEIQDPGPLSQVSHNGVTPNITDPATGLGTAC